MADENRYYRVSPRIWTANRHWSEDARTLAMYILTCPHRTVEGLFWLPKAYIQADLQWSPQRLAKPFQELLDDGFIEYDADAEVVLIVGALRYQQPANANMVTAAIRQLRDVPKSPLDQRFYALAQQFCQRLAERLPQRFGKPPAPTPAPTPTPETLSTPAGVNGDTPDPGPDFDDFWQAYPRHHATGRPGGGGSRKKAAQRWKRLTVEQRHAALRGAGHYAAEVAQTGAFVAHAATWLNEDRWEQHQQPAVIDHRDRSPPPRLTAAEQRTARSREARRRALQQQQQEGLP